jgi:hypothetical protein
LVMRRRAGRSAPTVTQAFDSTGGDAGWLRGWRAGPGMDRDLAGEVDNLAPTVNDASVHDAMIRPNAASSAARSVAVDLEPW